LAERTAEFIIGLLGGIIGLLAAPGLFFLGTLVAAFGGGAGIFGAAVLGGILAIIGLVAAAFVRSRPKIAGGTMLACGVLGLFVALGLWIGALLFIVAGIVALIRKEIPSPPPPPQQVFYCTNCGKPMSFIEQYKRWYCSNCKIYAPT
jgi:hypothetical protein